MSIVPAQPGAGAMPRRGAANAAASPLPVSGSSSGEWLNWELTTQELFCIAKIPTEVRPRNPPKVWSFRALVPNQKSKILKLGPQTGSKDGSAWEGGDQVTRFRPSVRPGLDQVASCFCR